VGHPPVSLVAGRRSAAKKRHRPRMGAVDDRARLLTMLMGTAGRYLGGVLPEVNRDLDYWRERAAGIPDEVLRANALGSLGKRGNIEGAALFGVLAPPAERARAVRALVAFQTAYNYLDALSEEPSEDPVGNADQLHQALLTALHPTAEHPDYYEHNERCSDAGYLEALVDACRRAASGLPSFSTFAPVAREAAARIVDFQALNRTRAEGGHEALERWALEEGSGRREVEWWETAASAGSSLAVHALIAGAASDLDVYDARAIGGAYYPWGGATHSLLDSMVDRREDEVNGQRSLLDYYGSTREAARGLGGLASRSIDEAGKLPEGITHRIILTVMCSYYLSAGDRDTEEARMIAKQLATVLGLPLHVAISMFQIRRLKLRLTGHPYT
jgi:tetraprenyl-beta-curcumene synthase